LSSIGLGAGVGAGFTLPLLGFDGFLATGFLTGFLGLVSETLEFF
jgi:hypothetical protein